MVSDQMAANSQEAWTSGGELSRSLEPPEQACRDQPNQWTGDAEAEVNFPQSSNAAPTGAAPVRGLKNPDEGLDSEASLRYLLNMSSPAVPPGGGGVSCDSHSEIYHPRSNNVLGSARIAPSSAFPIKER
ncbi:hypothetical protein PCANC_07405 [Puccinia coronata f. sp. avenae]|nr:hypothetical protein PCANC_07405 [Puccinia coronata f. sp. avenae]